MSFAELIADARFSRALTSPRPQASSQPESFDLLWWVFARLIPFTWKATSPFFLTGIVIYWQASGMDRPSMLTAGVIFFGALSIGARMGRRNSPCGHSSWEVLRHPSREGIWLARWLARAPRLFWRGAGVASAALVTHRLDEPATLALIATLFVTPLWSATTNATQKLCEHRDTSVWKLLVTGLDSLLVFAWCNFVLNIIFIRDQAQLREWELLVVASFGLLALISILLNLVHQYRRISHTEASDAHVGYEAPRVQQEKEGRALDLAPLSAQSSIGRPGDAAHSVLGHMRARLFLEFGSFKLGSLSWQAIVRLPAVLLAVGAIFGAMEDRVQLFLAVAAVLCTVTPGNIEVSENYWLKGAGYSLQSRAIIFLGMLGHLITILAALAAFAFVDPIASRIATLAVLISTSILRLGWRGLARSNEYDWSWSGCGLGLVALILLLVTRYYPTSVDALWLSLAATFFGLVGIIARLIRANESNLLDLMQDHLAEIHIDHITKQTRHLSNG